MISTKHVTTKTSHAMAASQTRLHQAEAQAGTWFRAVLDDHIMGKSWEIMVQHGGKMGMAQNY